MSTSPSVFRSSDKNAMPCFIAIAGEDKRTDFWFSLISPLSTGSRPKIALATPAAARSNQAGKTRRILPWCNVKEISAKLPSAIKIDDFQNRFASSYCHTLLFSQFTPNHVLHNFLLSNSSVGDVLTTSPLRSTVTRCAISKTSSRIWEINRMETPRALSWRMVSNSLIFPCAQ